MENVNFYMIFFLKNLIFEDGQTFWGNYIHFILDGVQMSLKINVFILLLDDASNSDHLVP